MGILSLNDLIKCSVGSMYAMAPYHKPYNIDNIVSEISKRFKAHPDAQNIMTNFWYVDITGPYGDFGLELKNFLDYVFDFHAYKELNLSPHELAAGVKVDDPRRTSFAFTSLYDDISEDDSFIDLEALTQVIEDDVRKIWYCQDKNYREDLARIKYHRKARI